MVKRWKWAHLFLLEIGVHGRILFQVHKGGKNCLCGHRLSGLLENSCLASPLQVVRRAEAAASSHLQNSDGKSFERNRQNNTVIFPLLFQVSRIVVIPVTYLIAFMFSFKVFY